LLHFLPKIVTTISPVTRPSPRTQVRVDSWRELFLRRNGGGRSSEGGKNDVQQPQPTNAALHVSNGPAISRWCSDMAAVGWNTGRSADVTSPIGEPVDATNQA
jgi:hypothetical protein